MKKIRDIIVEYTEKLTPHSQSARLDVEILICYVYGINSKLDLIMNYDKILDDEKLKYFDKLFNMRVNHMPIAYIVKQKEFMGMDFYVNENVLIPRPDTELIVEELISIIESSQHHVNVLDMCSGSGAIAISAAKLSCHEDVKFYGVDISTAALEVANTNKKRLSADVKFIQSDLFSSSELDFLKNNLDILVSNPPYIEEAVILGLDRDVRDYEPRLALSAGKDGMFFYNKIIDTAPEYLKSGGYIIFESGHNQAAKIMQKLSSSNFENIYTKKDIQGFDRMVVARFIGNKK